MTENPTAGLSEAERLARIVRPWTLCDDGGRFDHGSDQAAEAILASDWLAHVTARVREAAWRDSRLDLAAELRESGAWSEVRMAEWVEMRADRAALALTAEETSEEATMTEGGMFPDIKGGVLVGTVILWHGAKPVPAGWLLADGRRIKRRDFPALYGVLRREFSRRGQVFLPDFTERPRLLPARAFTPAQTETTVLAPDCVYIIRAEDGDD